MYLCIDKYNQFMKYKLQQETKPKLSTFGKYKAVAVHQQTVGTKEITEECVEEMIPIDEVVYKTALSQIAKVVKRHLRNAPRSTFVGLASISSQRASTACRISTTALSTNAKKIIRLKSLIDHY